MMMQEVGTEKALSESNIQSDHRLDAIGLECPEPVFRARLMLDRMQPGEVLEVCADDPLAELDLMVFCEQTGHALLSSQSTEAGMIVRIRRRP